MIETAEGGSRTGDSRLPPRPAWSGEPAGVAEAVGISGYIFRKGCGLMKTPPRNKPEQMPLFPPDPAPVDIRFQSYRAGKIRMQATVMSFDLTVAVLAEAFEQPDQS